MRRKLRSGTTQRLGARHAGRCGSILTRFPGATRPLAPSPGEPVGQAGRPSSMASHGLAKRLVGAFGWACAVQCAAPKPAKYFLKTQVSSTSTCVWIAARCWPRPSAGVAVQPVAAFDVVMSVSSRSLPARAPCLGARQSRGSGRGPFTNAERLTARPAQKQSAGEHQAPAAGSRRSPSGTHQGSRRRRR